MKKNAQLLMFLLFSSLFLYSQPKSSKKNIPVKKYSEGKLYLLKYKYDNGANYYYLTTEKTKFKRSVYTNEKNDTLQNLIFILKKDTMRLNIQYKIRDDLELKINNFNFLKGNYNIDLYNYVKEKTKNMSEIKLPFVIKNFPNDCLEY